MITQDILPFYVFFHHSVEHTILLVVMEKFLLIL
jgi:hypothetical protein